MSLKDSSPLARGRDLQIRHLRVVVLRKGENREVIENSAFAGMWPEGLGLLPAGPVFALHSIAGTPACNLSNVAETHRDCSS